MVFPTVSEATRIWIKGRQFSIARLLGPKYADEAERYQDGSLAIFRLAPQDYHRYHAPVSGVAERFVNIDGEYYTVNPQAIRSGIDVYGSNVRQVITFDTAEFGKVLAIQVGAMMVGSILTTIEDGQRVQKGDEYGFFAFGGSTIILCFEPQSVEFDEDLVRNSQASLETLVKMGVKLGRSIRN